MKKLIVVVSSAGIDPWLSIEMLAQQPALSELTKGDFPVVWVSGNPACAQSEAVEAFDKLFTKSIASKSQPNSFVSRIKRIVWSLRISTGTHDKRLRGFFAEFAQDEAHVANSRVVLPFPVPLSLAGLRTVETFRYLLDTHDFDYALRITSTCLFNPTALASLVENLPVERVVCGTLKRYGFTKFYSGAAILLSRDVLENLVEHEHLYPLDVWEDVGLGATISGMGWADFLHLPRVDIAEAEGVGSLSDATLEKTVIFRCKTEQSGTRPAQVGAVMAALVDRLSK